MRTHFGRWTPCLTKQAAARRLRLFAFMKTIVYVDGLNLYYGSLRGTPHKWLDLHALFTNESVVRDCEVNLIRYYTAPAKASSSDDPQSPLRQQRYLRALKTYLGDRIQIVQGYIARTTPCLRLVQPCSSEIRKVRVFQFTEKRTDVNLAADLISDACHARCKQAVLCSNDSDLVGALAVVRRDHPELVVGLVACENTGIWCAT
jgi:6-hydroxy-3-succinoylpyridine 3-monooxygenase